MIIILLLIAIILPTVSLASGLNIGIDDTGLITIHKGKSKAPSAWNELIEKYKGFIVGVSAIGALTSLLLFIKAFIALGASENNQYQRQAAIKGVLWTGISTALLGATGLITSIFYGIV